MSALPTAYSLLRRQPWVHSARIDTVFLLAPGPLATVFALWLLGSGRGRLDVSPWLWLGLVVGIDVAHVYATLYRTYLDRWERQRLSAWLVSAPLGTWVLGVALYSARPGIFWSALAYAAVFHFVRQQYGFLMLYARAEGSLPQWCRRIDHVAIYGATLFPLLYWHTHLPRAFSWLIEGDFFRLPALLWTVLGPLYALLGLAYLAKEAWLTRHLRVFNLPRNALVLGTFASWFVGIVLAQGDLIFTLINVVAHGVPYIALTCIYGQRRERQLRSARPLFVRWRLPLAVGLLVLLAYAEEGCWDGWVWREHLALFPGFDAFSPIEDGKLLSLLVPLLSVPQMTHYLLDGVIWRLRAHPEWRATLFWQTSATAESP